MFEKLVESTKQKGSRRTGRLFLITTLIYGAMLTTTGVATIFWFNPVLADTFKLESMLVPPVPPVSRPVVQQTITRNNAVPAGFVPPVNPPPTANPTEVPPGPNRNRVMIDGVVGSPLISDGVPGSARNDSFAGDPPPPPAPRKPAPTPELKPDPTPTPNRIVRTSTILQGTAIRKVQPPYPPIAKAARIQGAVQVQVEISEEGQVISAVVLSGHPLLREASVQAARQWLWRPTILGDKPVKVQGVLTFNFTLTQ